MNHLSLDLEDISSAIERLADSKFDENDTPPNGSSIAFQAECGGKSALFKGDALPSVLEVGIRQLLQTRQRS